MVSRHPLLRHLAVMVLVVLLPCMSDAATVVVQTTPQVTYTEVNNFMWTYVRFDVRNRVYGFDARFRSSDWFISSYYSDTVVASMERTSPAASITRRGAEEVGVSGLSGLEIEALLKIVSVVYNADGRVTEMTLNCGSESAADIIVALVNSGREPGFSSAEKQKFLPAGGIIGIVFAVIAIGTVAAVGVYWKFLKSGGREVGDATDNQDGTASKDDTADTADTAHKDATGNQDDTANKDDNNKDDTANKDATGNQDANKDDAADKNDTNNKDDPANTAYTCVTEVFPSPTNQPF